METLLDELGVRVVAGASNRSRGSCVKTLWEGLYLHGGAVLLRENPALGQFLESPAQGQRRLVKRLTRRRAPVKRPSCRGRFGQSRKATTLLDGMHVNGGAFPFCDPFQGKMVL